MAIGDGISAFGMGQTWQRPVYKRDIDPNDWQARQNRMQAHEQYTASNPGAAAGGTGRTGLTSNDAQGWSRLLEQQSQYAADQAAMAGKAAPVTRLHSYGPAVGGGGGAVRAKGGTVGPQTAALRGLAAAQGGGRIHPNQDPSVPQAVRENPELYKAYEMDLLTGMQARSTANRRSMMSPMASAQEKMATLEQYGDPLAEFGREQEYKGVMNTADATEDAYWRHERPRVIEEADRDSELATIKGLPTILAAQQGLAGRQYSADASMANNQNSNSNQLVMQILRSLVQDMGSARQYGDQERVDALAPRVDQMTQPQIGGPQGGAPGGTGVPQHGEERQVEDGVVVYDSNDGQWYYKD